jgi:hypothetical protein
MSGGQGGIIPVNLSTRLTQNLKTSHQIFVGSPALCCENKLWAKYHKNKVLVIRIKVIRNELMSIKIRGTCGNYWLLK